MKENIKKPLIFIALTFFFSWLLPTIFVLLGGNWNTAGATIMSVAYMFIPMTIAIIVQQTIYKEPVKDVLGVSWKINRWWFVAWLLPPVIAFATFGISFILPGVQFSPEMAGMFERFKEFLTPEQVAEMQKMTAASPIHPIWFGLIQGLIAGVTLNAAVAFGEEAGWRGFLQKEFAYMGFWKSSTLIGLIWGVWHAPLILQGHNYPQHPVTGVFMMTIFCILASPIFSYIRLRAKSVIAAAIMHGTLNATAGLAIMVLNGGNDLTIGVTGVAGLLVLLIINVCIFFLDRSFVSRPVEL